MTIRIRKAEKKDAQKLSELLVTIAQLHHEGRPDIYGTGGAKYNIADVEKKISNTDELILVAVNEDDVVMGYTMSKIIDVEENGILLERAYKENGIDLEVHIKPECAHHPHGLENPEPIVEFILSHS